MKTIEEAISNALDRANELGECQLAKSYRQLAGWLTELRDIKSGVTPLSDRLTAEEMEKIMREYQIDDEGVTQCSWDELLELAIKNKQKRDMLERIFGKDMFTEDAIKGNNYNHE